jgi:phage gpG-like protein
MDTGRLAASIQGDSGPDFAEAGTSVSYAVYHVSSAPRTKIPLRDFFDLSEDVYDDIERFLLEELSRA